MPRSPEHKARTRERVIDAAANRFRRQGFADARVDEIMADAGLTHGGFYAHFPSKAALLVEVIASRNDLLRRLRERPGPDLRVQGRAILDAYVNPAHQAYVGPGCTVANLAAEAARYGEESRAAFAGGLSALAGEIVRGETDQGRETVGSRATAGKRQRGASEQGVSAAAGRAAREDALAVLAMAVGAVALARGAEGDPVAAELLTAVRKRIPALLDGIATPAPGRAASRKESRR